VNRVRPVARAAPLTRWRFGCKGCQHCVWRFADFNVLPAGQPLLSAMSFLSIASMVLWAGPTSSRDATNSGYPSLTAPAGDHSGGCGWISQVPA
jgi:hypothetical protein